MIDGSAAVTVTDLDRFTALSRPPISGMSSTFTPVGHFCIHGFYRGETVEKI